MDQSWDILKESLDENVLKAVEHLNFKNMTPVQAACIPHFIRNKDVAVEAVTGSGKTLAFVVPMMHMLCRRELPLKKNEVGAVIITPTRELAFQINEVASHFISFCSGLTTCLFIGGSNRQADIEKFSSDGGSIVIATPGRLEDLLGEKDKNFNLGGSMKSLEVLILDEADRLLEMGFDQSINTILSFLPKLRRTGLFSATQTDEVGKLIRAGLRNPMQIAVKEKASKLGMVQKTPSTLQNYYTIVEADKKVDHLVLFLREHSKEKIMVFFSTCACVDYFSVCLQQILKKQTIVPIHGKVKKKRNSVFADFRKLTSGILICTDVMARGVDIPDVHWVIQFDPPSSASAFVHRCGRTARIGNTGNALVMLLPSEDSYVQFIAINQKVHLSELPAKPSTDEMNNRLQTLAINDRSIYVKGLRAFVSFIQSYAKHECSMILRLKDLDYGLLAQGYGLLHIPKMPELRGKCVKNFQPVEIDVTTIAFKDKAREKMRLAMLESGEEKKRKMRRPPKSEAWSKQKERKDRKRKRTEGKSLKSNRVAVTEPEDDKNDDMDDDNFDNDISLMKRLKRGKISQEDFDKEFAGDMSD